MNIVPGAVAASSTAAKIILVSSGDEDIKVGAELLPVPWKQIKNKNISILTELTSAPDQKIQCLLQSAYAII